MPVNVHEVAALTVAERVTVPPAADSDEGLADRSVAFVRTGLGARTDEVAPATPGSTMVVASTRTMITMG
jgi:hypothetical protein